MIRKTTRMRKVLQTLLTIGLLALGFSMTHVASARLDKIPYSRYTWARAAGMGNTGIPIADDGMSAMFYNPGAIARLDNVDFEAVNVSGGINQDYLGLGTTNMWRGLTLPTMVSALKEYPNTRPGSFAAYAPSFSFRGFAVGGLLQMDTRSKFNGGVVEYISSYEMIPAAGVGLRLAKGIVRLGYSLQWVNKTEGRRIVNTSELQGFTDGLKKGSGLSHTAAYNLTLPIRYLPNVDIVARNLLNTTYGMPSLLPLGTAVSGTPTTEVMSLDVALYGQPKFFWGSLANFILEYRNALDPLAYGYLGQVGLGMEFSFMQGLVNLRMGWSSGYPTAGFGLHREYGDFNVAWFSEELGTTYHSERDIKWLFQYQVRAF